MVFFQIFERLKRTKWYRSHILLLLFRGHDLVEWYSEVYITQEESSESNTYSPSEDQSGNIFLQEGRLTSNVSLKDGMSLETILYIPRTTLGRKNGR